MVKSIFGSLDYVSKAGIISGLFGLVGGLSATFEHLVMGIASNDVIAFIGVIGGVMTVVVNLGLGWYHKIEKARRAEYRAWRLAKEGPVRSANDDTPVEAALSCPEFGTAMCPLAKDPVKAPDPKGA